MKVGFTGTRNGMTRLQITMFQLIVNKFPSVMLVTEFHHGDCVGADSEASKTVDTLAQGTCVIVGHPGNRDSLRAFERCDIVRERKPFLERNHDIVDETDLLIATPATLYEMQRSGTWATIRYAQRKNKPVAILPPLDKKEVVENFHKRR